MAGGGDANSKSLTAVPHIYYGHKVNEDTAIGIGIYAPFGSGSEFPDNQWAGRYHAVETEQSTVNINPTISVDLSDSVSMGLGAVIQSYEATLTNQIVLGYLVAESVVNELDEPGDDLVKKILEEAEALNRDPEDPTQVNKADVTNEIEMDSIGYGFSFGLLWEVREDTRVGFNYRSRVQHVATGEIKRPNLDDAGEEIEKALAELLGDEESINDPSTRGGEELADGEDLRRRDLVQPLELSDTMRYGLGARYQYNDREVLRTGASYQANEDVMVDVGYAYTRIKEADVSAQENPAGTLHRAVGTTRTNTHSLGLQASYNF